ncbi:MAG: alkaline shock response membrane anchor protein AmaP [Clostridia bacterium]|nr:alkaline shock response membrane anchor protein AmaP [Clostridia bacterium]
MKILEKFVLIIYSLLILIISSIICLLIFRVIDIENITEWIELVLTDASVSIIVLGVSIIFILLSIKCLFFRSRKKIKKSNTTDILLENDSGRLLISKNAIENTVKNVINDAVSSNPETKVIIDIDPANNLSVYISILLSSDVKVRDFTIGLQMKIKNEIKEHFDLEVKQVNIKIDDVEKKEINKIDKKIEEKKGANMIDKKTEERENINIEHKKIEKEQEVNMINKETDKKQDVIET